MGFDSAYQAAEKGVGWVNACQYVITFLSDWPGTPGQTGKELSASEGARCWKERISWGKQRPSRQWCE
jgi:hypothetical protein